MSYNISIAVNEKKSTTDKGKLLENLTSEIMQLQQYKVVKTIRITGMEIDVLAKHKYTSEEILVECKAWSDTLPADVITKLLGNVYINNASAGWLITTGPLGKDAEGLRVKWEDKPTEEKRKLVFYTNDRIMDLLISNNMIVKPEIFVNTISKEIYINDNFTLLITDLGKFWIIPFSNFAGDIARSVLVFEATKGNPITDKQVLKKLQQLKTIYSEYEWISNSNMSNIALIDKKDTEYQNIVTVMSGDDWTDYRPSRPCDFVGREDLINSVLDFFESVKNNSTETRLFAIKSPSGWGKSSTLIKIIEQAKKIDKNECFIYAVDVRTAISPRYAELAFKSCLETAIKDNFINFKLDNLKVGDVDNILNTESIKLILKQLKSTKKCIVLIFDQFEEIFSKKELYGLFENIRRISNSIDAMKENIILGFAWKTDLSIPVDHPAYYLWSNLRERRKEFDLFQFREKEIKSAINVFSKQIGQKVNPILTRYLIRQCQGYPWLLKKLCIHVYNLIEQGYDQEVILGRTLNIKDLFEKEIGALTVEENGCVNSIAKESPADYFKISEIYGQNIIQNLINKRMVIKRSTKLILYWDIFKDYVLNKTIPIINVDYIPQVQFTTVGKVISVLLEKKKIEATELAYQTSLGINTIDNILIDLVMFGIVTREKKIITLNFNTINEVSKCLQEFFMRHIVYVKLLEVCIGDGYFDYTSYAAIFKKLYSSDSLSEKTQNIYSVKLLNWLINLNLVSENNSSFSINKNPELVNDITKKKNTYSLRGRSTRNNYVKNVNTFWPQTSPNRVLSFYQFIQNEKAISREELIKNGYKKVIEDMISLKAITFNYNNKIEILLSLGELINKLKTLQNYTFAIIQITENKNIKVEELANKINLKFNKNWTSGTKRVTGGMIYRWANFLILN